MTPLVLASASGVLAALLGLATLRIVRGVPLRYVEGRERLRVSLGSAFVAIPLALVLAALRVPGPFACALALLISLLPAWASARLHRHARAVTGLARSLARAARPGEARALLLARLEVLPAGTPTSAEHAELVALAASSLRRAGFVEDAHRAVHALDVEALAAESRSRVVFERAAVALVRGDLELAEQELARDASAHPALRALTHAVQGGADQALTLLEQGDFQGESGVIALAARIHVLASMGRDEDAEQSLAEMLAAHGLGALSWVLRPVGPATDRARSRFRVGPSGDAIDE